MQTPSLTRCSSSKWRRIGRGNTFSSRRDNKYISRKCSTEILISGQLRIPCTVSKSSLIALMRSQSKIGGEQGAHHSPKRRGGNRTRGHKRARPGRISAAAPQTWGRSWTKSSSCTCWRWSSATRCHNLAWTSTHGWELSSGARLCARWAQVWCGRGLETYILCCFSTR